MRDAGTKSIRIPTFFESAKTDSPIEEGVQVGRYQLLVPIARGGMAEVWVARLLGELGFSRLFALKTIRSEFADDPSFRERFFEEARIAARLRHTNIVEVVDLGEEGSILFQVMTLVEGDSIAALARAHGRFDPAIAARITGDALAGLHAAHELTDDHGTRLELVHRDISPHNILVGVDGISKLTDFGVAKVLGGLPDDLLFGDARGKPGYLAPEQLAKKELDRRADVFASGVVLWELLAGTKLFSGDVGPTRAPDPREYGSEISDEVANVVKRALELERNDRYATALEMSDALEAAIRPATARDVARLVNELCSASLKEMRESVRKAAVGAVKSTPPAALAAGLAQPAAQAATYSEKETAIEPLRALKHTPDTVLIPRTAVPEGPEERASRTIPIAVLSFAVLAGISIAYLRFAPEDPPAAPVPKIADAPPVVPVHTATISLDIGDFRDNPPPQPAQRRGIKRDKNRPKPKFKNPYTQ